MTDWNRRRFASGLGRERLEAGFKVLPNSLERRA
jgi:hypothetical protein